MPPANMQTRAVPRSRIVARSELYSRCSRSVIYPSSRSSQAGGESCRYPGYQEKRPAGIVAQDLVRARSWARPYEVWFVRGDNSLAVYELSATLRFVRFPLLQRSVN